MLICLYFVYTSSKANLIQMAKTESPPVTFLLILPVSKLLHKGEGNMCPLLIAYFRYFPHFGHNDCSFSARTFDYSEKEGEQSNSPFFEKVNGAKMPKVGKKGNRD